MARWNWLLPRWLVTTAFAFVALVCVAGSVSGQNSTVVGPSVALEALVINVPVVESNNDEAGSLPGTAVSSVSSEVSPEQVSDLAGIPETLAVDQPLPDTEDESFKELKAILGAIPTGQEALSIREKYQVSVRFEASGGSRFSPASNSIVIDSDLDPVRAALTLVHEMNHAQYHHEGLSADAKTLSREEFVMRRVEEEVEGVVKSIDARMELEAVGVDVSHLFLPFALEYQMYVEIALERAKGETPARSDVELRSIGREAGKERVLQGFMRGCVVTSNTEETYPDYYGKWWDSEQDGQ